MKRINLPTLLVLAIPLLFAGCDKNSGNLNDERQRRIRAESWIRRAESALNSCKRHVANLQRQRRQRRNRCSGSVNTRVRALQRQINAVRRQLNAKNQQLNRSRQQLHAQNRQVNVMTRELARLRTWVRIAQMKARGQGAVRVLAVRRHRGWLSPALRKQLSTPPPGLKSCYRRFGVSGKQPVKVAFWTIIGTHRHGAHGAGAGLGRMPGSPHTAFRRCVAGVLNRQRAWKTPQSARFALLLAFAPKAADLRGLARPAFRWPWKPFAGGKYARSGQVCRLGTRALRGHGALNPYVSRPCAPGLKCCYPCGIQGCNSVCLKDCGPPRP